MYVFSRVSGRICLAVSSFCFDKDNFIRKGVTVQYPHSYRQKSMQDRLWRWDFCLAMVHLLAVSAVNAQTY